MKHFIPNAILNLDKLNQTKNDLLVTYSELNQTKGDLITTQEKLYRTENELTVTQGKKFELEKELKDNTGTSKIGIAARGFFEKFKNEIPLINDDPIEWYLSGVPNYIISQSNLIKKQYDEIHYLKLQIDNSENQSLTKFRDIHQNILEIKSSIPASLGFNISDNPMDLLKSLPNLIKEITVLYQQSPAIAKIDKMNWLDNYFDQGQRTYFEKTYKETADVTPTAILSFLINHSLSKLHVAIYNGDEIKELTMLNNLYLISEKMREVRGFNLGFEGLNKIFNAKFLLELNLSESTEEHRDDRLFQVMLNCLIQKGINIAPFYIDIDKDGKLHRVN